MKTENKTQFDILCDIERLAAFIHEKSVLKNNSNLIINLGHKQIEICWIQNDYPHLNLSSQYSAFQNHRDYYGGWICINTHNGYMNPLQFNDDELSKIHNTLEMRAKLMIDRAIEDGY